LTQENARALSRRHGFYLHPPSRFWFFDGVEVFAAFMETQSLVFPYFGVIMKIDRIASAQ
jgi:hypothetical protein